MPLDKNYPDKKSIGEDVKKGASAYLDSMDRLRKKQEKEAELYDKQAKKRAETMRYLRRQGGK
jgi:hypothetical protein